MWRYFSATASSRALDQAVDVVALGLDVDLEARLAGGLAGDRADRDDAGAAGKRVAERLVRLRTVEEEVKVT